uniref:Reverse transcriptase domain-containing protein n=1 Tax=Hordeum vulgare subsp. vulgare TaxID=112509 RepID=A0A8I6XNI9_HORVV
MTIPTTGITYEGVQGSMKETCSILCKKGSVGIKVNDDIGHFFQTLKGLRQRDPMSPILFNVVVHMLVILIRRSKQEDQVGGLVPHLMDDGVSILQYADDIILFMEHDVAKVKNNKLILCLFKQIVTFKN